MRDETGGSVDGGKAFGPSGDAGHAGTQLVQNGGPQHAVRRGPTRRKLVAGAAWAVPTVLVAGAAPAFAASGKLCGDGTLWNSVCSGQFLQGSLLNTPLSTYTAIAGAAAAAWDFTKVNTAGEPANYQAAIAGQNVGADPNQTPTSGIVSDLHAPAIDLHALGTSLVSLGLGLPLNTSAGVYNQYASASQVATTGFGGSGAVSSSSGAIDLNAMNNPSAPAVATVDLKKVLASVSPTVAATVNQFVNLSLQIGAVAAIADIASCGLTRDYGIASLKVNANSTSVTALGGVIKALDGTSITLTKSQIGVPGVASVTGGFVVHVSSGLLAGPLPTNPDPTNPLQALTMNLSTGDVTLDLDPITGHLNTRPANTRLLIDTNLISSSGTGTLLGSWINTVLGNYVTIDGTITIKIGSVNVTLTASGSIVSPTISVNDPTHLLDLVITGLLNTLKGAIAALTTGATFTAALGNVQNGVIAPIAQLINGVLSIVVNKQDPLDPAALPNPTGHFTETALYIAALGALDVLSLSLANAAVGSQYNR